MEEWRKIEFDFAVLQVVEHLVRGAVAAVIKREQFFHVVNIEVRHAPAFDFSRGTELLKSLYRLLECWCPFAPVQEVKIDCVNAQALETAFAGLGQLRSRRMERINFRDNEHALALTFDRISDDFF